MALVSPKTPADRFLHALTGCIPDVDGNVTLEPTNHIANWRLSLLEDTGEPEDFEMGYPEEPDGFWVYMSEVNGAPSTLAAQNSQPIPMDEDGYYLIEPYVEGHAPVDKQFAARIAAPDAPEAVLRERQTLGFAAGTYLVSYTWIDGIAHTALAPAIVVEVGLGQDIRITLPSQFPEGASHIGIWLSSPGGGVDTMRLQVYYELATLMESTVLLKGPWRSKRAPAGANETYIPPPKAPILYRNKNAGGDTKSGTYRVRVTRVDRRNGRESSPSPYSNTVVITGSDADAGIGLEIIVAIEGSYYVYVERNGTEYRLNTEESGGTAGSSRPQSSERNSRSDSRSSSGKRRRKKKRRQRHRARGKTTAERTASGVPTRSDLSPTTRGSTTSGSGTSSTQSSEDTGSPIVVTEEQEVVVEDPDAPLDGALPEGRINIPPGDYWIAISYAVRGNETVISPLEKKTLDTSHDILVKLPDNNNLLSNAQWVDRDSNGVADTWEFSGRSTGSVWYTEDGSMVLDTLGLKTGTQLTPGAYQEVFPNRSQFYAIGGKMSTLLSAGSAVVEMLEYSSTNSLLRSTTLLTVSSTGANVSFNKVFGSSAGYTAFHDDMDWIALQVRFSGSSRSGQIYMHEMYVNPGSSNRVRRTIPPLPGSREFSDPDPPAHIRWNKQSIVGIMLPPNVGSFPTDHAPIVQQDFETTSLQGFTLRQSSSTGTFAGREAAAAIGGGFGYRIQKDTSSTRYTYLYADMGATRENGAVSFRVKVPRLPNRGILHLGGIKSQQKDGTGATSSTGSLVGMALKYSGDLLLYYRKGGDQYITAAKGVRAGDVLDVEIRLFSANSSAGRAALFFGKNSAPRKQVASISGLDYSGHFARYAYVGPYGASDPAATYTLHYDDIVLTESGFISGDLSTPPEGFAYENPDRPFRDPTVIEDATFDTGSLPTGWSATRSPLDSTTAVAVETTAKIDGTYGVRCTDTGTATTASAYITRTLSPTRTAGGFRARMRVVIAPGAGSIDLMHLLSSGGQILGRFRLDSAGDLYAQTLDAAGALFKQTRVARAVFSGTILTLEMAANGVGTSAATMAYWLSVGGSGAVSERNLWAQHILAPFSGLNLATVRAGICAESTAGSTSTLHVDSARITEAGEVLFSEYDELGRSIYQFYGYYPSGTPVRDDLGLKEWEDAVQPNETYTFAIKCRHRDVPQEAPAYPYTLYAYDTSGAEHELGSVYGAGGAVGTGGWADRSLTFTVPDECYIVRMMQPGISSGEFVAQEPALSRGTEATREVYYPASGETWAILDTVSPQSFAFAPEDANPIENRWLDIGSIVDAPEGTSYAIQYNSANPNPAADVTGTEQPTSWLSDPLFVVPRRYAHFLIQLSASSDLRTSPTLRTESPYVDFYPRIGGEQISCLLRDDMSEFDGGVWILSDIGFFENIAEYDVRQPLGMVRKQQLYDPVGNLPGFTMRAYTAQAIRDIRENWHLDFAIESRDYRLIVRFRERPSFSITGETKKVRGVWCAEAEASVDGVEVVEAMPINALIDSLVAP